MPICSKHPVRLAFSMFPSAFTDRREAGRSLGAAVGRERLPRPIVVLGLPRGGVPVAYEVARALHAPLDVLPVRKIGLPGQPELAIGAVASADVTVRQMPDGLEMDPADFARLAAQEYSKLRERESLYRGDRPALELKNRTAVIVDDGLATGATMLAAVRAARRAGAARVVVAAPVASDEAVALMRRECDALVILQVPPFLRAVGAWYVDFSQVEDSEVRQLLAAAGTQAVASAPDESSPGSAF